MSYWNAFAVGTAGAILFSVATILLTVFAAWMYDGDPSGRGAYGFSLLLTVPISFVVGGIFGLYLGLS